MLLNNDIIMIMKELGTLITTNYHQNGGRTEIYMNKIYRLLPIMHLFVGIGAIPGGLCAMLDPYSPMGIPANSLKNSPFDNFFIPGLILITVIGLGNILSGLLFHYRLKYQGYISSIFSWALVIWIIVQCIMISSVAVLHIIYFLIGLIEAFLSFLLLYEQNLFPGNILSMLLKNFKKA